MSEFRRRLMMKLANIPPTSISGKYMMVGVNDVLLYSRDYGKNWSAKVIIAGYAHGKVALTKDGKLQMVMIFNPSSFADPNYIYTSKNFTNWSRKFTIESQLQIISLSANDGKYMLAGEEYGKLHQSKDYGNTWNDVALADGEWYGSAISDDGKYQMATANGTLYLSKDFGNTFNNVHLSSANFQGCAMSSDGQYLYAVDSEGYIHISKDKGATWSSTLVAALFDGICCSNDGSYILLSNISGPAYYSEDYGINWEVASSSLKNSSHPAISDNAQYQLGISEDLKKTILSSDRGETFTSKIDAFSNYYSGCAINK